MFNTSCWLEYCYSFYCHDRLLCTLRAFLRRWILSVVFSQIIYFGHLPTLIYEHYLSIISLDIRSGMISPVRFLPTTSDLNSLYDTLCARFLSAGILITQLSLYLALVYIYKWCRELKLPDIRLFLLFQLVRYSLLQFILSRFSSSLCHDHVL